MNVTVQYLAQMKRAAGCSSESAELREGATLRELLSNLAERHGSPLSTMLLDESAQPRRSLLFFIGDEHAEPVRLLRNGDTVTILAPMAGGA